MAFVNSIRPRQSGGSGSTIGSAIEDFVQADGFSGLILTLSPPLGATILFDSIIVNYQEKMLIRNNGAGTPNADYNVAGNDIYILFDDTDAGEVVFQIQYLYTT